MTLLFYILDCAILIFLARALIRIFRKSPIKKALLPSLILKVLAGIGMGILYKYYYNEGDTFSYFNEAVKINALLKSDFQAYMNFLFFNEGITVHQMQYAGQPRALFMVKLVSVVNVFTYNNYWFSSVFFSFFSFCGLWILADKLSGVYRNKKTAIVFSLLFFPTVVFWSSGIIKESVALGAIGFLLASFLHYLFYQKKAAGYYVLDILMLFLLWNTKYYFAGALLLLMMASIFTVLLYRKIKALSESVSHQLITFAVLCLLFLALVSLLHPNFYFYRIMGVIAENYHAFLVKSDPQDVIHYHDLQANALSLLMNAPKALFSGLFRPFIGEGTSIVKMLAGVENLILFILSVTALLALPGQLTFINRLLVVSMIIYCAAMSIFLALSVPNFGTLIRYKTGFLPIFLLLITMKNPLIERINALVK